MLNHFRQVRDVVWPTSTSWSGHITPVVSDRLWTTMSTCVLWQSLKVVYMMLAMTVYWLENVVTSAFAKQELNYCWDGRAVLHKSNFRFRLGVPLFNALFLLICEHITTHHLLPKSRSFGLHFYRRQHGSNFNHSVVIGPRKLPNSLK